MSIKTISTSFQFSQITIKDDYRKKWNVDNTDFVILTKNGQLIRETLYRIGGMCSLRLNQDIDKDYIIILKYEEALYDNSITKDKNKKRHLADKWCIIDRDGNEKKVFDSYASPYLKGGVIYSENNKYYNIETGELYCESYTYLFSDEYVFLDNAYDNDKSRRGVMKIHKKTGRYEIFPKV